MIKRQSFFLIPVLLVSVSIPGYASAHSMFNSAEEFYGGYRVQVATTPEFPQIGEQSEFLIRVTDSNFEEVDGFTVGIRVFYHDQQIDAILPRSVDGAHLNLDYAWNNPGNHIVKIDLYMEDQDTLTYTFNIGTQSPFGYIFIAAITVGALCLAGVVGYIFVPNIIRRQ